MIDRPDVSVVIPHLNQPEQLRRCLTSVLSQSDAVAEVIVVDNGSDLAPTSVCADFDGVRLLSETEPGPGPARNRGAAAARGDVIAFLDADCIAGPNWLRTISAVFDREPATDVIGGRVDIAMTDPATPTMIEAYEAVFGYRMEMYVRRDSYTATCNMAVRRDVFAAVGPFGARDIAEDMDWGRRATDLGFRLRFEPDMRISTPAREDFGALQQKWDRHISHDFAVLQPRRADRLRWLVRSVVIGVSPIPAVVSIARADQLATLRARALAAWCTLRIRLYRSRRMTSLLSGSNHAEFTAGWNRPSA